MLLQGSSASRASSPMETPRTLAQVLSAGLVVGGGADKVGVFQRAALSPQRCFSGGPPLQTSPTAVTRAFSSGARFAQAIPVRSSSPLRAAQAAAVDPRPTLAPPPSLLQRAMVVPGADVVIQGHRFHRVTMSSRSQSPPHAVSPLRMVSSLPMGRHTVGAPGTRVGAATLAAYGGQVPQNGSAPDLATPAPFFPHHTGAFSPRTPRGYQVLGPPRVATSPPRPAQAQVPGPVPLPAAAFSTPSAASMVAPAVPAPAALGAIGHLRGAPVGTAPAAAAAYAHVPEPPRATGARSPPVKHVQDQAPSCRSAAPLPPVAASQAPQEEPVKLAPGAEVCVGDLILDCIDVLGSGSYSVVWRAAVVGTTPGAPFGMNGGPKWWKDGYEVALKDVHCKSPMALQQTLFEVQLLVALEQQVLESSEAGGEYPLRLPRCLSHSVLPCKDGWCVRTVMNILPGEQLDQWLNREAEAAASAALAVPPEDLEGRVAAWSSQLARGCALSRALLLQLGPTLERLAPLAWHRDVNSHNVLISDGGATFWLCDLGLAADARAWPSAGEGAKGAWRVTDIGGDCRYWPPSCWMVHCHGTEYLEARRDFCEQYQRRLDVHGLGITALEALCSTALAARSPNGAAFDDEDDGPWGQLLAAWRRYWDTVGAWWERIYAVFSEGGDLRPVHAWLTQEQVAEKTISLLAKLHEALEACARITDPATARLLRVLRALTSEASDLALRDACTLVQEERVSANGYAPAQAAPTAAAAAGAPAPAVQAHAAWEPAAAGSRRPSVAERVIEEEDEARMRLEEGCSGAREEVARVEARIRDAEAAAENGFAGQG